MILSHAHIILPGSTVVGSVVIEGNRIAAIEPGRHYSDGLDLGGQLLIPGIIDIHSDYLERELNPRPSAAFPLAMAFHMMDVRAIACGLTTVLGAARISGAPTFNADGSRHEGIRNDGILLAKEFLKLKEESLARHLLHIRWNPNFEPAEAVLAEMLELSSIGNLVYNDSAPGERQFRNLEDLIRRFAVRQNVTIEAARADFQARTDLAARVNNRQAVKAAVAGRIPIGSHDDTTVEHVDEAFAAGASLAEMPVTIEAARRAKELGMLVCMGAPNYYRGGSHCGNLSAVEAMAENLVDIFCSDFHFPTLLASASRMILGGGSASAAINLMTLHPAMHLGLDNEFGSIEVGKKADLVAFTPRPDFGQVSHVWVDGKMKIRAGGVL